MKKEKNNKGTSFNEQAIFYYVKQFFNDSVNRKKFNFNSDKSIELDIFIPSLNFAIEYDGVYWHNNKVEVDSLKNKLLFDSNVTLVRVRECGLPDLTFNYGEVLYSKVKTGDKGETIVFLINKIFRIIEKHILNIGREYKNLDEICKFVLTEDRLINDRPNIYAQYFTKYQPNNIEKTCLIKFWDFEKNGNLNPKNVDRNSNIYIVLTCPKGYSQHIQPKTYKLNKNLDKAKCKDCILNVCPVLSGCPGIIRWLNQECTQCDLYNNTNKHLKYVYNFEQHREKSNCYGSKKEKFKCTKDIICKLDFKGYYEETKSAFLGKIKDIEHSLTTKNMLIWLNSIINSLDQFILIMALREYGKRENEEVFNMLKEIFCDRKAILFGCSIDIKVPHEEVINVFKDLGSKKFSYRSLLGFDTVELRDEFYKTLLSEIKNNEQEIIKINDVALTLCIKEEYELYTTEFSRYLYDILTELKADYHPRIKECKELLYTKLAKEM